MTSDPAPKKCYQLLSPSTKDIKIKGSEEFEITTVTSGFQPSTSVLTLKEDPFPIF